MQRWIQRALADLQLIVGSLLDDAGNGVAMGGPEQEGLQHHHVEGALKEVGLLVRPWSFAL